MKQREPNPEESRPEITFSDYLRNCRLGRAFARIFAGSDPRNPGQAGRIHDVEGGSVGFLGRFRKTAIEGGLASLTRPFKKASGSAAASGSDAGTSSQVAESAASVEAAPPLVAANLESVGAVLRRTREGYEEDLAAVAQTLHIRLAYLQAIEDRRFERLPGPAYAVGFIRAYSDYLGLDSADMVRRFKIEVEGLDKRQELFFPVPVSESKVPGGAVILVSLLLVAVAYGAWFYLTSSDRPVAEAVPPVPEELGGPPAEEQVASAAVESQSAEAEAPAEAAETSEPAEEPEASEAVEPTAETAETAETETAEQVASAEASAPEAPAPASAEAAAESSAEGEAVTEQGSSAGEAITAAIARSVDSSAEAAGQAATETTFEVSGGTGGSGSEAERAGLAGSAEPRPGSEEAADRMNALSLARILKRPADLVRQPSPQSEAERQGAIPEQAGAGRGASRQPLPGSPGIVVPSAEEGEIPRAPATEQLVARPEARTPQVFGAENEATRIVLRATQDSWVQIRDGNDDLLLTRVLRRGDEYRVPDQNGLTLLTGNAGGIEIVVDGAALSPLGPVGAVRRNIQLDPERLLEGTAIPSR